MYRSYLIAAFAALAAFSYAQYQGWSPLDEAEQVRGNLGQTQRHK